MHILYSMESEKNKLVPFFDYLLQYISLSFPQRQAISKTKPNGPTKEEMKGVIGQAEIYIALRFCVIE